MGLLLFCAIDKRLRSDTYPVCMYAPLFHMLFNQALGRNSARYRFAVDTSTLSCGPPVRSPVKFNIPHPVVAIYPKVDEQAHVDTASIVRATEMRTPYLDNRGGKASQFFSDRTLFVAELADFRAEFRPFVILINTEMNQFRSIHPCGVSIYGLYTTFFI